jgi:hypothetical protein
MRAREARHQRSDKSSMNEISEAVSGVADTLVDASNKDHPALGSL